MFMDRYQLAIKVMELLDVSTMVLLAVQSNHITIEEASMFHAEIARDICRLMSSWIKTFDSWEGRPGDDVKIALVPYSYLDLIEADDW
jgi:D-serine deaminase-like pyridoxal phosphate-dependent protein